MFISTVLDQCIGKFATLWEAGEEANLVLNAKAFSRDNARDSCTAHGGAPAPEQDAIELNKWLKERVNFSEERRCCIDQSGLLL